MLELRLLRYFVAVADELHFSRAATKLNIATTTLSHQIKTLEAGLGGQLLWRNKNKPVTLTELGQRFLLEARRTLDQAEHAERIGRRAARGEVGRVIVGYVMSMGLCGLLGPAIREFRQKYQGVDLDFRHGETFPQLRALDSGAVDVAFTRETTSLPSGLDGFRVAQFDCVLALPSGHPLANLKKIRLRDLVDESFVAGPIENDVAFVDNVATIFSRQRRPKIVARAADVMSVLLMVSAGVGIAVFSTAMTRLQLPGVVYRRFPAPMRTANHALVYRRNETTAAVISFVNFMRKRWPG